MAYASRNVDVVLSADSEKKRAWTAAEVSLNDGTDGRPLWVTYRGSVHDVTYFQHPGGNFIKQAAGGAVEPFWDKWAYHYDRPKVDKALDDTRIGYLIQDPIVADVEPTISGLEQQYSRDPVRDPSKLRQLIDRPFSGETYPLALKPYLTSADALYIRNHAPVPMDLEMESHTIRFSGGDTFGEIDLDLSLLDMLGRFPSQSVTSVLQCAGNRAAHDRAATGENGFKNTPYEVIEIGMVGNVSWSGISLSSVLRDVYPEECAAELAADKPIWHLNLVGADGYETSVPLNYAIDERNECLLATTMNGDALTADHGFPVRAVLPGVVGARQVKWLESLFLTRTISDSPWSAHYYLSSDGYDIQKMPMQSLILSPSDNETISVSANDTLVVEGVSYSGGSGANIAKVEVSIDDGKTWTEAHLLSAELEPSVQKGDRCFFGWVRFRANIDLHQRPISSAERKISVCCRATDTNGVSQPQVSKKHRGYIYNGWHYTHPNLN